VDWSGRVLWEVRHPDHHHDARRLRNGNVVLLCSRPLPAELIGRIQGGIPGTEVGGTMYGDYIVEMTTGGQVVWEWRSWEHLDPAAHPITPQDRRAEWTHGNTVAETADGHNRGQLPKHLDCRHDRSRDREDRLDARRPASRPAA
jgi:hypothetical protein